MRSLTRIAAPKRVSPFALPASIRNHSGGREMSIPTVQTSFNPRVE